MKIIFNIPFHTMWGQTLYVIGSIPELGSWDTASAKEMSYIADGNWVYELELPNKAISFEYRYFMSSDNKLIFEEWQKNHCLEISNTNQSYVLLDYWQNKPRDLAFYSSAFTKSLFAHTCSKDERVVKGKQKILLKVLAPYIFQNQSLAILGNQDELGNWDESKVLVMNYKTFPEWWIEIDASRIHFPIEYKFCIVNDKDKSIVAWEKGENRILNVPFIKEKEVIIVSGLQFRSKEPNWKCAGLVIPVFSLRSENSFGIGDFGDLCKMVNWVKQTNQKIIQILPINDTTMTHTWIDSYPYNSISIYALHPIYLDINAVGKLKDKNRNEYYKKKQIELNGFPAVDYEQVDRFKWEFYRELYEQEADNVLVSDEFTTFFQGNKDWLIPYAAYSYLRDKIGTADFHLWKEYSVYDKQSVENLCSKESSSYKAVAIYYYLQFHLHQQLTKVRDYCYSNGIVLKGDIPIGISSVSIEAWTEPSYFNMNVQAGAPPDDFSVTGQNWGFPTYNWDVMEVDQFSWWKKRFRKMSDYFDAYRIDHILGFFRIWEIPDQSVEGLLGYFNPALPFSLTEIEDSGLKFNKEQFIQASIHEQNLSQLFGEYTSEVILFHFDKIAPDRFVLKKEWNTQKKIQAYFAGKEDKKSKQIKSGLFAVCNEVLFIEDKDRENYYHPRISAGSSYVYNELDNQNKYAFDYLYWHYFYQRHNEFWKDQAYKRLVPLVNSTDMLVCGEDLGMIPQSVSEVMNKLEVLSLEIERMPKSPQLEFSQLRHNPYLSVCTPSTHDMSTIRGWWKENKEKTQRYYNEILWKRGEAPEDCTSEICEQIICNHLASGSMLCIISFQDWLSINETLRNPDIATERINVPTNSRHYWKYRMHLTIEELLRADELNDKIRGLIAISHR